MSSHFITGIDIGTNSIKAIVAQRTNSGKVIPKLFIKEPSAGMRRGAIIEVAEAAPAVARVVAEIKKFSKDAATNIYAAIGTTQIKVQTSRGIVAVSRTDSEIYQDDIERVVKASQAIQLAPNRMVIHSITREFIVDGAADIIDPLGLKGNRLESNSLIVDAFAPHVRNVMRSVELGLGEVSGLVFPPLALYIV
jgi:cell division protein FtsA